MGSPLVTRLKTVKEETQTFHEWNDLADPIIKTMGFDMWDAIQILKDREVEHHDEEYGPSVIDYVEDGIFQEQIQESDVIKQIFDYLISALDEQGFIKKNKSLSNFEYAEGDVSEIIDCALSPGLMNYFERDDK